MTNLDNHQVPQVKAVTPTTKSRILEYVRSHPQCTTPQIKDALQLPDVARIGMQLLRLRCAGLVSGQRERGQRLATWTAIDEDSDEFDMPQRSVRQSWTLEHGRDPLVAALFGPAAKVTPC